MRFRGHYTTGLMLDQSLISFIARSNFYHRYSPPMPAGAGAYENEFPLICFLVSSAPRSSARDSMRIRPDFADSNETITSRRPTNSSSLARNRTSPGPRSDPGIALFKSGQIDRQSKKRIPVIQFLLDTHNGLILNRSMRGVPEQAVAPLTS